jgi:hypothetical protein
VELFVSQGDGMDKEYVSWMDWTCVMCNGENSADVFTPYNPHDYCCQWCGYEWKPEDFPLVGDDPEHEQYPDVNEIPF